MRSLPGNGTIFHIMCLFGRIKFLKQSQATEHSERMNYLKTTAFWDVSYLKYSCSTFIQNVGKYNTRPHGNTCQTQTFTVTASNLEWSFSCSELLIEVLKRLLPVIHIQHHGISYQYIFYNYLWHEDPLLGNDRELRNYTTVVNRKRPINRSRGKVFYVRSVPRSYKQDELRAAIRSSVILCCCCEQLVADAGGSPSLDAAIKHG
jgi:hypothetical protein